MKALVPRTRPFANGLWKTVAIFAGPNWEIYGHWTDDPAQLRTDVFYLLDCAEE